MAADPPDRASVARRLAELSRGAPDPVDDALVQVVYDELRSIARRLMARERAHHTLQPTALVHEAFVRLAGRDARFEDRGRFCALAAQVMRHVLVDHARATRAAKRGGGAARVTFEDALLPATPESSGVAVLELHDALQALAAEDPRCARVAELRLFGDASIDEIADELGVASSTVGNEWRYARAWLRRTLSEG